MKASAFDYARATSIEDLDSTVLNAGESRAGGQVDTVGDCEKNRAIRRAVFHPILTACILGAIQTVALIRTNRITPIACSTPFRTRSISVSFFT